jgi:hypothetical protein
MRVGIDFSGVICDNIEPKQTLAREMFGVEIPIESCGGKLIVASGILSSEQYDELQREMYGTRRALDARPISDSIEALQALKLSNDVFIVTGADPPSIPYRLEWLKQHGIGDLPLHAVGARGSKKLEGIDLHVDDRLAVLVGLAEHCEKYLFNRPYNLRDEVNTSIRRIDSLFEIV